LVKVVVNGSVTPSVSGWSYLSGSGLLTISRMRWFCQPQTANATTKAPIATMIRERSSSRWATSVSCSSWATGFTRGIASASSLRSRPGG
jgi:hypothetical protein